MNCVRFFDPISFAAVVLKTIRNLYLGLIDFPDNNDEFLLLVWSEPDDHTFFECLFQVLAKRAKIWRK